jgi:hypothetical protein
LTVIAVLLPAMLALLLAVLWLVVEWKAPRGWRIALGVAMIAAVYSAAVSMSRFRTYLDERQLRSCMLSIQRSLEQSRGEDVVRALRDFETAARSGDRNARYALCDEVDKIARGAYSQPK